MLADDADLRKGLDQLEIALLLRNKPSLEWCVRWSDGGRIDPVEGAWASSKNPYAMVGVITRLSGYKFPGDGPCWCINFAMAESTRLILHVVSPSGLVANFECGQSEAADRIRAEVDAPTLEIVLRSVESITR